MIIHQISLIAWSADSPMDTSVVLKDFDTGTSFSFKLPEAAVQAIGEIVRDVATAQNVRIDGAKLNPEVPCAPMLEGNLEDYVDSLND